MHSILVLSDIHGDIDTLNLILEKENYDYVFFLGDAIDYYWKEENKEVIDKLSNISKILFSVKGNCDNFEIDGIFNFGLTYIRNITINDKKVTLTHGHIYNRTNLPEECGQIFLSGHTHVGSIEKIGDRIIANPGSISKPRGGSSRSYIILDEECIVLKKLNGEVIKKVELK